MIVATGATASAVAAKAATRTIPIVFISGGDPVQFKLVDSFNRPGGNLTGVSFLANRLASKQLDLLQQLTPGTAPIGVLVNPTNPTLAGSLWKDAQEAADTLGIQVHLLNASTEEDFVRAFDILKQLNARAVIIGADGFFTSRIGVLAQLAAKHTMPAICSYREFSTSGGLISYGTSVINAYRQVGVYTGKVLKGEKPADLPVLQPTKFEFVVNLKTAKALGIEVPQNILVLADEVIDRSHICCWPIRGLGVMSDLSSQSPPKRTSTKPSLIRHDEGSSRRRFDFRSIEAINTPKDFNAK